MIDVSFVDLLNKVKIMCSRYKTIIVLLLLNLYFLVSLFLGNNTLLKFIEYKDKQKSLIERRHELLKKRYQLEQISSLLANEDSDSEDVDELLRQKLHSSLPDEKIVIL